MVLEEERPFSCAGHLLFWYLVLSDPWHIIKVKHWEHSHLDHQCSPSDGWGLTILAQKTVTRTHGKLMHQPLPFLYHSRPQIRTGTKQ
jgi:hypothetical protein